MIVKAHPHRTRYLSENPEYSVPCISVTPVKRHGRAYYMGTLGLRNAKFVVHKSGVKRMEAEGVRNVHAWIQGELVHEATEQNDPSPTLLRHMTKVVYDFKAGRFVTYHEDPAKREDVTDEEFAAAYCVGRDFYVARKR